MKSSKVLKTELEALTGKRNDLKKRLSQLRKVKLSILTGFDSQISTINNNEYSAENSLLIGLEGLSVVSSLNSSLNKFVQKGVDSDSNMSSVIENINYEIKRIESDIDTYDTKISSKNSAIKQAKEAEKANK